DPGGQGRAPAGGGEGRGGARRPPHPAPPRAPPASLPPPLLEASAAVIHPVPGEGALLADHPAAAHAERLPDPVGVVRTRLDRQGDGEPPWDGPRRPRSVPHLRGGCQSAAPDRTWVTVVCLLGPGSSRVGARAGPHPSACNEAGAAATAAPRGLAFASKRGAPRNISVCARKLKPMSGLA